MQRSSWCAVWSDEAQPSDDVLSSADRLFLKINFIVMPQRHLIRLNCCPCGERRWIASHCSALKKCTNIYQAITGQSVQPDVLVSVLSMIPGSMKAIKKYILRHMLTAARTVIARKWRKMADPSIEEWVCEMSEIQFLYVRSRSKGTNLKDMATMGGVQNLSNFIKLFVEQ